jgi:hypothetical protein
MYQLDETGVERVREAVTESQQATADQSQTFHYRFRSERETALHSLHWHSKHRATWYHICEQLERKWMPFLFGPGKQHRCDPGGFMAKLLPDIKALRTTPHKATRSLPWLSPDHVFDGEAHHLMIYRVPRLQRLLTYNELYGDQWIRRLQRQFPETELLPGPRVVPRKQTQPLTDDDKLDLLINQQTANSVTRRFRTSYMLFAVHQRERQAVAHVEGNGIALPDGRSCRKIIDRHPTGVLSVDVVPLSAIRDAAMLRELAVNRDCQGEFWVHKPSITLWRQSRMAEDSESETETVTVTVLPRSADGVGYPSGL